MDYSKWNQSSLLAERKKLEAKKKEIYRYQFLGGGNKIALFCILTFGIGLIVWMSVSLNNKSKVKGIDAKIRKITAIVDQRHKDFVVSKIKGKK